MKIGPNFHDELIAAGVSDLRLSWSEDGGITFAKAVPRAERDKVMAVLAAHDPAAPAPAPDMGAAIDAEIAASPALDRLVKVMARRLPGVPNARALIDEIKAEP